MPLDPTPLANAWPYDADQHDPLTALRIPVTSYSPDWWYIACFDRDSEVRPTDGEAAMIASYIEEYKEHSFIDWYKVKLLERPFDLDTMTRVFHKWGENDWSYRVVTWQSGPFWVPVAPRLRGGEYDYPEVPGPMTLEQVMAHTMVDKRMQNWTTWKAEHPDIFGAAT